MIVYQSYTNDKEKLRKVSSEVTSDRMRNEEREIRRLTSDIYISKEHLEAYKNISYRVALWTD